MNQIEAEYDFYPPRLQVGDHCGTSKFITVQGFSYFGDIIAAKPAAVQQKTRTMRTLTKEQSLVPQRGRTEAINRAPTRAVRATQKEQNQGQNSQKPDQNFTTCLFIPQNRMHLIPYYDYYTVREATRNRPEFDRLRRDPKVTDYIRRLKKFTSSAKRDAE